MGDYWQQTVELLQNTKKPIIEKPKLQEKYLTKPPFRYLHDVISAVQSNTGFAPGLYSGDELVAQGIQDKDAKVAYLNKMINVVGIVMGEHVPAKPLKIVAGLEPENTNLFLQMLARACQMNNGADAVQRVLGGDSQPAEGAAPRQAPPAARPSSRPASQQRLEEDPGFGPTTTPPEPAPAPVEHQSRSKRSDQDKHKERKSSKHADPPPPPPPVEEEKPSTPPPAKTKSRKPKEEPPPLGPPEPPPPRAASPPPPTDDPMRRSVMRPQSARKAPPKIPSPSPVVTSGVRRGANAPPGGGGPAQSIAARPIKVFEDGAAGNSDDEVEVVHSAAPIAVGPSRGGEQGVLVKDILAAEQDLKKAGADAAAVQEQEEGGGTGIILKRLGKPTAATGAAGIKAGDTGAIRELVQKLCQASHPLAKSMDYLAEDLDNMAKEYRFWQTERRVFSDKLADEQRLVGDSTAGDTQLADLDAQVKQVQDRILGLKAAVLRNDETISKLLAMAVGVAK